MVNKQHTYLLKNQEKILVKEGYGNGKRIQEERERTLPVGIIPSYMAVFDYSEFRHLILSGKDVKIRQNLQKEAKNSL